MDTPSCRYCGAGPDKQTVRAETVFGGKPEHRFWLCSGCDLVHLFPIPSEEEEARFYAKEFEKFMASRAGSDRDWTGPEAHIRTNQDQVRRRWAFMERFMSAGQTVLEVGCSSGFMMDSFRDRGLMPTGVEPSGEFIEFLEKRGHRAYPSMTALTEAEPEARWDRIVHFFVLEHVRDTLAFLREQLALLRPGGAVVFEVPCVNDPLTSLYKIPAFERFYWSIAHHYYFSPKALSRQLDTLGVRYELFPEQRYDLSNHAVWMQEGRPGGQGRYSDVFSPELIERYRQDLKAAWKCDTIFGVLWKA